MVPTLQSGILGLTRHWLLLLNGAAGLFVLLPWLAPVLMSAGWEPPARGIYRAYSLICHQLPQRSYFLFGQAVSYGAQEVQALTGVDDPLALGSFVGNPSFGYKVALAHRLSAVYVAALGVSLHFSLVRSRLRPLPLRGYLVLVLPMFLDGLTHLLTDVAVVDWRATNAWAGRWLPGWPGPAFYLTDALGSLNWLLRSLTGAVFGAASAWLVLPHAAQAFRQIREDLEVGPGTRISR